MCADSPMKYILVTGGVISGIGKGIIASSIGTILKSCGLRVTAIKIDPYINIDAGTFSPYEHGMKTGAVAFCINICIYNNVFCLCVLKKTNRMVFTTCFIIVLKVYCLLCFQGHCSKLRNRNLFF